jgi:hypothetical protein
MLRTKLSWAFGPFFYALALKTAFGANAAVWVRSALFAFMRKASPELNVQSQMARLQWDGEWDHFPGMPRHTLQRACVFRMSSLIAGQFDIQRASAYPGTKALGFRGFGAEKVSHAKGGSETDLLNGDHMEGRSRHCPTGREPGCSSVWGLSAFGTFLKSTAAIQSAYPVRTKAPGLQRGEHSDSDHISRFWSFFPKSTSAMNPHATLLFAHRFFDLLLGLGGGGGADFSRLGGGDGFELENTTDDRGNDKDRQSDDGAQGGAILV